MAPLKGLITNKNGDTLEISVETGETVTLRNTTGNHFKLYEKVIITFDYTENRYNQVLKEVDCYEDATLY